MKPLVVRPLAAGYDPGYPRFTEVTDWASLLGPDPALGSRHAALFAGILGSCLLVAEGHAAEPPPKVGPPLKSPNAEAAQIANRALDEVKASGHWYSDSTQRKVEIVAGQPKVTIPSIRISFGNSYVGILDVARARKATIEMFAAYGVKLETKHAFKREGVEFEADGFDPVRKVGFEIVGADRKRGEFGLGELDGHPTETLDGPELEVLKKRVASGDDSLFLPPAEAFAVMDSDEYTPLRAYLQSALDYLDWLARQGRLK